MMRVSALEWFLVAVCCLWGVVLLLPPDQFAGPGRRSYEAMAVAASEQTWGAWILALGVVQAGGLVAYTISGVERRLLRIGALGLMTGFYALLASMFAVVSLGLLGPWLWGLFALAAAWSTWVAAGRFR